ncbi:MAG: hypothetical protein ACFFAY_12895 [Promethearchaeota archaeon]
MLNSEELLVRLDSTSIEFPEVCPICGAPATRRGILLASLRIGSNSSYSPRFWGMRRSRRPPTHIRRGLDIPICEKHYLSDLAKKKARVPAVFFGGVFLVLLFFLAVNITFRLMDGVFVDYYWYVALFGTFAITAVSLNQMGSTVLDDAVSIRKVEIGSQWIVLRIRHMWYFEKLLQLNPQTAKRVSIVRRTQ